MFFCAILVLSSFIKYVVCKDQLPKYYCINPIAPNCLSSSFAMSPDTPMVNTLETSCWDLLEFIRSPLHTICHSDLLSQLGPYRRYRIWILCKSTYTSCNALKKTLNLLELLKLTLTFHIVPVKFEISEFINPPL